MKKIFFSLFLIPAVALVSCSKILDQTPTDRYTDAQVWQDAYLIECHLDNLYAMSCHMIGDSPCTYGNSPVNVEFSSSWHWNYNLGMSAQGEGPIHANEIADDAKHSEYGAQYQYTSLKLYGHLRNGTYLRWWSNGYYLNRQLNHFLENIDESPVSDKDAFKSEARFLRAYNYFAMAKRYGGVPLITKETPIDAPDEEMYPKRNTEKEVYDFIIDELEDCAQYLPDSPQSGRAGKGAAYTLLSRVALYAGCEQKYGTVALEGLNGIAAGGDKNYFQIAANAAKKVMSMGKYALYSGSASTVESLRDIFLVEDNCEQILVKRHKGSAGSVYRWSWDICNCPKPNAWGVGEYILPYYDLVEKIENVDGSAVMDRKTLQSKPYTMDELFGKKDPRFHAWFWTNGSDWTNGGGANGSRVYEDGTVALWCGLYDPEYNEGTVSNLAPHVKFAGNNETYQRGSGPTVDVFGNQMLEMNRTWGYSNRHTGFGVRKLLDPNADNKNWFCCSTTDYPIFRYAEVLLNYAEAQAELGNASEAKSALDQIRARAGMPGVAAGTVDAVRHEREIEMCFENQRYWDLRRWHKAVEYLNDANTGIAYILDYPSLMVNGGAPKFWVEIKDRVDSQDQLPTFPENNYYMPIGDGTIAINPNLVENPGY